MESASLIGKSLRVLFSIKTLYGQRWYHNMIDRVLGYKKLDMVYQTKNFVILLIVNLHGLYIIIWVKE